MSAREGYASVFVMNCDGSGQRNLPPKDLGDDEIVWISRAPSWSTTGRQIYKRSHGGMDRASVCLLVTQGSRVLPT
jgi:Tol biopolymer transport system component